jgi:hypothetical protein
MTLIARISLTAACLVAWTTSSYGQAASRDWTVYLRRVGPLHIGASIDDVRRQIGDPKSLLAQSFTESRNLPNEPDDSPCSYLLTKHVPSQIGLMFQKGVLVRIDIRRPGIRTASGAQVGDSEASILKRYGARIQVTQHHYPPAGAHYMTYTPADEADRGYELLFETDGTKVTQFRVGLREAVTQVEGCA